MTPPQIHAAVAALAAADPATCDRVALAELAALSHRVRGWLDAFDAALAVQSARCSEPAAAVLAVDGRRTAREVRTIAARGDVCAAMPTFGAALAEGAVSSGHVDAVARVAGQLDGEARAVLVEQAPALVMAAATSSVDGFERRVRDLGRRIAGDDGLRQRERIRRQRHLRRWTDRETGLCHTHVALDPEDDARLAASLDAAVAAERTKPDGEERTFDQLRADAFVALIAGVRAPGRQPPEVAVLIDHDTLVDGLHDRSVCETSEAQPIPPASVRRLACEASIVPLVVGGDGTVLGHGRSRRVATADQRRALRAMYRTCGHPGCPVRFADCEVHHVVEWLRQRGPTDLANLLPLCSTHHHLVHEGEWRLELRPDRTITLRRPDGSVAFDGSTIDVAPAGIAAEVDLTGRARARLAELLDGGRAA